MKNIHVCIAFDERYAPHAAALIVSIMDHRDKEDFLVFHILADRVSGRTKNLFLNMVDKSVCKINFIDVKDEFFANHGLPKWRGSYSAYLRLFMGSFLPQDVHKVIYLDCDIIVATSLAPLFGTDITGKYAAVVGEAWGGGNMQFQFAPKGQVYFNSGVMLLNLIMYRADNFERQVLDRSIELKDYLLFPDQDLLNNMFAGNFVLLPPQWQSSFLTKSMHDECLNLFKRNNTNCCYTEQEILTACEHPCIIHFVSGGKPWRKSCRHPLRHLYWQALKKTPFYQGVLIQYFAQSLVKIANKINPLYYVCRITGHKQRKAIREKQLANTIKLAEILERRRAG